MTWPKLKLRLDPIGRGEVTLDGVPLKRVTRIELDLKAGKVASIKLHMIADLDVEIDATEAEIIPVATP